MVWTICLLLKLLVMQVCVSQSVSEPSQFAKYDMIMSRIAEKMELMQNRIAYLERSEKSFKQSISALIGANAQLRMKIQELEAKQDAMAVTMEKDSQHAESDSNDADTQPQQIADKTDQRKNAIQRSTEHIENCFNKTIGNTIKFVSCICLLHSILKPIRMCALVQTGLIYVFLKYHKLV